MGSDYFETVATKTSTKNKETFSKDDCRFDLLPGYYKSQTRPIESNLKNVDLMFKEWCDLLFNGYNIAVQGSQSKFRLLETFKARYLDSGRIPDFKCSSPENGTSTLNITTVRLHGMSPVTVELFCHDLFEVKESRINVSEARDKFLNDTRKSKTHHVFLMHSFELLFQKSQAITELIFQMFKLEPHYIHILLSADHIYAGKILNKLKFQLQLSFYNVTYGESFFHEKTHSFATIDHSDNVADNVFMRQLDLYSLRDIHQGLQAGCKSIMVYILNNYVQASLQADTESKQDADKRTSRRLVTHKIARSPDVDFDKLMDHCRSTLFINRANVVKNHLGELVDHQVVTFDERTKKISCLMSVGICKKFLDLVQEN